jgi:hypothetical protein
MQIGFRYVQTFQESSPSSGGTPEDAEATEIVDLSGDGWLSIE